MMKCKSHHHRTEAGMRRRRIYDIWRCAIKRCDLPSDKKYHIYGGRGIDVCDEWRSSFQCFYEWCIRNGYGDGLQFDRIDNDGDYTPGNCRFVDPRTNVRNSRTAKLNTVTSLAIHGLRAMRMSTFQITMYVGVSEATVRCVLSGRRWQEACDLWKELVRKAGRRQMISQQGKGPRNEQSSLLALGLPMKPGDIFGSKVIAGVPFMVRNDAGQQYAMVVCTNESGSHVLCTLDEVLFPKRRPSSSIDSVTSHSHSVISSPVDSRMRAHSGHRLNGIWREMIRRCYDKKRAKYPRYGGRGIRVCDEWRTSYEQFFVWSMDNGYGPDLQIDRIDNDGDYCPGNCRWVDCRTNIRNGPTAKLSIIEAVGIHAALTLGISQFDLAVHLGVSERTVASVASKKTWTDAGDLWEELVNRLKAADLISRM